MFVIVLTLALWAGLTTSLRIFSSAAFQLCQLQIEEYSMVLNPTLYDDARSACDSFGLDLLEMSDGSKSIKEGPVLSTIGSMLLDCAAFGGFQVTAGWVSNVDARGRLVGGPYGNCFAVDVTGTFITGSVSACQSGRLHPVCVKRKDGSAISGRLVKETVEESPQIADKEQGPTHSVPLQSHHHPICNVTATKLPMCPMTIFGFKVITTRLTYQEGVCACRAVGMTIADSSVLSFWPAAVLTHHCTAACSMAWIESEDHSGCIAMKAVNLKLLGPKIVSQPCNKLLPVVCAGPILDSWDDLAPIMSLMNLEKFGNVLRSLYPLPRLPSVLEIARMAPILKSTGNICRTSKYQVILIEDKETAEEACQRSKMHLASTGSLEEQYAIERIARECSLIPAEGVRIAAPSDFKCAFMDKSGSLYLAQSKLAMALYQPCHRPSIALCMAP